MMTPLFLGSKKDLILNLFIISLIKCRISHTYTHTHTHTHTHTYTHTYADTHTHTHTQIYIYIYMYYINIYIYIYLFNLYCARHTLVFSSYIYTYIIINVCHYVWMIIPTFCSYGFLVWSTQRCLRQLLVLSYLSICWSFVSISPRNPILSYFMSCISLLRLVNRR